MLMLVGASPCTAEIESLYLWQSSIVSVLNIKAVCMLVTVNLATGFPSEFYWMKPNC